MAEIVGKKTQIQMGRQIRVKNLSKKQFAKDEYVAIWLEDCNGKNKKCYLFTDSQIEVATKRAAANKEDLTQINRIIKALS